MPCSSGSILRNGVYVAPTQEKCSGGASPRQVSFLVHLVHLVPTSSIISVTSLGRPLLLWR